VLYLTPPVDEALPAIRTGRLGAIVEPRSGPARWAVLADADWIADNGAFGNRFDPERWQTFLRRVSIYRDRCLFAVVPDAVADAEQTRRLWERWSPVARDLGYPVAYVAQDGCGPDDPPWDELDAIFVGGTTDYKLGSLAADVVGEALRRHRPAHMGRVNSWKRLSYAADLGCRTADGTFLLFGPARNLPRVERWTNRLASRSTLPFQQVPATVPDAPVLPGGHNPETENR
jgi:hypothetical protein